MSDDYSSDTHSIADGLNRAKNAMLNKQDKIPATVVDKKDLRPLSKRKVKIMDRKAEVARKSGDFFTGSRFGDDKGRSYSVKDAIKTAKRKGQSVSLPTSGFVKNQVDNYWQGNMERTKKADYSKPVLVVKNKNINEDGGTPAVATGPTMSTGRGYIDSIGVGPKGEPGRPSQMMPMLRRRKSNFAEAAVFEVSSAIFHSLTMQKRKNKHWRTYLEEDDCFSEIREYANKNKGPIIVQNETTGEMRYVRYKG